MKNTLLKLLALILVFSMTFTMVFSSVVMAEEEGTAEETTGESTDDTTGDDTTGDDTTGDDTTGDDTTGDDTTGDDTTGDDTTGDDTTGDDTTGDDTTGDDTTGDDTTGDDTTGDDTTGDDTTGDDTTGDDTDDEDADYSEEIATITYEGAKGEAITFSDTDFVKAYKDATGKNFRHFVVDSLPSSVNGTLYYDYKGSDQEKISQGDKIKKSDIDDVSYVSKKENCGFIIGITYHGENSGDPVLEGEIEVEITDGDSSDSDIDTVSYTVYNDDEIDFDGEDFYDVFADAGKDLRGIEITKIPTTSQGVLYYEYEGQHEKKIAKGDEFYYDDDPDISDITFVPKSSFDGTITLTYKGYYTSSKYIEGKITIKVKDADDDDDDDDESDVDNVSYTLYNDDEIDFDGEDFYDVFDDAGEDLISIEFKTVPTTSQGVLYYEYEGQHEEKIAKGDEFYYDDDPDISDITFVPKSSYDGTITLTYKGYYTKSKYIEGKITIKVKDADDDDDDDDDSDVDNVSYTMYNDDELEFDSEDFYDVFDDVGEELLGIAFTSVPTTSQGVLYYDYDGRDEEKIAKGDEFYYDDDPDISDITFVPKSSYTGTITLSYKGYYTKSKYITAKITIKVKDADGDDDEDDSIKSITLTGKTGEDVAMNASTMNSAFKSATGSALSYVKFSIPSSSAGKLYYDYDGDDEEAVTSSDKYYYSGSSYELIKDVSFVPKSGFTGTVTINYNAYKSGSSKAYPGVIKISYSGSQSSSSANKADTTVNYKGVSDAGVKMGYTEFNNASVRATESPCASVRFGAVAGGAGALYLYYGEANQTLVSAGSTFYTDKKPNITDVTFIPAEGFKGTASISYFGQSNEGDNFNGYVKIQIIGKPVETIPAKKFADVAEDSWYKDIVYKVCEAELMKGNENGTFNPEGEMSVAEAITMACRIHNKAKGGKDSDFTATSVWYEAYVNYALANGIIKDGDFADYNGKATREEMAYIFYNSVKAEDLAPINAWVVPDVDKAGKFGVEIYALSDAGILAGNDSIGTFNPKTNIKRAEAATILGRLGKIIDRVKK